MKVNPNKINDLYVSSKRDEAAAAEKIGAALTPAKDSMIITSSGKERGSVEGIVRRASEGINKETSPAYLLKLKREISNGTYNVSGKAVAAAMMGRASEDDGE